MGSISAQGDNGPARVITCRWLCSDARKTLPDVKVRSLYHPCIPQIDGAVRGQLPC